MCARAHLRHHRHHLQKRCRPSKRGGPLEKRCCCSPSPAISPLPPTPSHPQPPLQQHARHTCSTDPTRAITPRSTLCSAGIPHSSRSAIPSSPLSPPIPPDNAPAPKLKPGPETETETETESCVLSMPPIPLLPLPPLPRTRQTYAVGQTPVGGVAPTTNQQRARWVDSTPPSENEGSVHSARSVRSARSGHEGRGGRRWRCVMVSSAGSGKVQAR